jgi:hypothetical protein
MIDIQFQRYMSSMRRLAQEILSEEHCAKTPLLVQPLYVPTMQQHSDIVIYLHSFDLTLISPPTTRRLTILIPNHLQTMASFTPTLLSTTPLDTLSADTYLTIPPSRNYNTAAYRSYIGFFALGIIATVLWVFVIGTLFFKMWLEASRVKKINEGQEEKQRDIEMAYVRLQEREKIASLGRDRVE